MPRPALRAPKGSPAALKQTLRVMAACAAAYAAFKLLGLKQGYWAVFTVLIVMQGSIGGTLGAALDRMLGTFIGAALGAAGAAIHDDSTLGIGLALVAATGIGAFIATLRPQLRIAPVTASIMLLTMPPGTPVAEFVIDRVVEIALGGAIGVAAMALILPARSQVVVKARAIEVLNRIAALLASMADAVQGRGEAAFSAELIALRAPLTAIETALKDANREHATRLSRHAIPAAVPRTLWRVRSDLVIAARALTPALPDPAVAAIGAPAAALLGGLRATIAACVEALRTGRAVDRPDLAAARDAFGAALGAFRHGEATIDMDLAGHLFGLAFALDELRRDLRDLADRIDEMSAGTTS